MSLSGLVHRLRSSTAFPYVAPFAALVSLMGGLRILAVPDRAVQVALVAVPALLLLFVCGPVRELHGPAVISNIWGSLLLGVFVFLVWIAPDRLFPGYRSHWLLSNLLTGSVGSSLSISARSNPLLLTLRTARAVLIVPVVEELFWRAWLLRWLVRADFENVELGTYSRRAFWTVAILFASEHGPYWDVGLAAGVLYNWWMVRTRNLGSLILAHGVTNACLSAYVLLAGRWEYWS